MPDLPFSKMPAIAKKKRPSSSARGYGAEHRRIRAQILNERPICENCGEEFTEDLHHADGNNRNTSRENLIAWCSRCHDKHHNTLRFG